MKKIYIDVGCNRGYYSFIWANSPESLIYAFEPNPKLYSKLKESESDRFKVFDYAIGTDEGVKTFNIGENDNTSSLKNFDKDFTAYGYVDSIQVNVIRLDNFCKQKGIEKVDLLKIDAQGSDLDVLHSMGDLIYNVDKILVEAWINDKVNVYEDEVKESQVMEYLIPKGFKLKNRAVDGNYCDLHFTRTV
jgi:FkbM family methyltransferase